MVSLQPISATSAYLLLPSQVVSICDLQQLALYWFHAPRLEQWTTKFSSQRTSHMEPSATSIMVIGPVGDRLQAGTEAHLFSTASQRHWDVFMILAPYIYIQTNLLTCFFTSHLTILMCVLWCGRYLAGAIVAGLSLYAALRYKHWSAAEVATCGSDNDASF